jgi:hypothetical protein
MRFIILIAIVAVCPANSSFGTWKMNEARSMFTGRAKPKRLSVRIEPHAKAKCSRWTWWKAMAGQRVPAASCTSMVHPGIFRISTARVPNRRVDRIAGRSRSEGSAQAAMGLG